MPSDTRPNASSCLARRASMGARHRRSRAHEAEPLPAVRASGSPSERRAGPSGDRGIVSCGGAGPDAEREPVKRLGRLGVEGIVVRGSLRVGTLGPKCREGALVPLIDAATVEALADLVRAHGLVRRAAINDAEAGESAVRAGGHRTQESRAELWLGRPRIDIGICIGSAIHRVGRVRAGRLVDRRLGATRAGHDRNEARHPNAPHPCTVAHAHATGPEVARTLAGGGSFWVW
jgi:hypothetical protein